MKRSRGTPRRQPAKPADEGMTRFAYLVAAVWLFELAIMLWIVGLIRPLS